MKFTRTRLPPMNALRTFYVVMRQGSLKEAAEELLVSPQAVSQQIKILEDWLDVVLFDRRGRKLHPTDSAKAFYAHVAHAFAVLGTGVEEAILDRESNRINVNASPYFAARHLINRLDLFRSQCPKVDIRLTTMAKLPNFGSDEIDVAIQWGYGDWPDYELTPLLKDPKIICCAPSFADRIRTPNDLNNFTLIHFEFMKDAWERVMTVLDVEYHSTENRIQFYDAASMRRAAWSGLGISLLSLPDAVEDVQAGRLIAPLGFDALNDMAPIDVPGFYLVLPKNSRRIKLVGTFARWVASQDWTLY